MIQGEDVFIAPTAILKNVIEVGSHISIDMCVYCSVSLYTGDWVHIAPMTSIIGGKTSILRIGNFSGISTGGRILCGSEDFVNSLCGFMPNEFKTITHGTTIFEDFSWVGAGSIVLPNITLAEGSVLGAGSVLTHDTEPWTLYMGNPAKPYKIRNKELILGNAYKLGYKK